MCLVLATLLKLSIGSAFPFEGFGLWRKNSLLLIKTIVCFIESCTVQHSFWSCHLPTTNIQRLLYSALITWKSAYWKSVLSAKIERPYVWIAFPLSPWKSHTRLTLVEVIVGYHIHRSTLLPVWPRLLGSSQFIFIDILLMISQHAFAFISRATSDNT